MLNTYVQELFGLITLNGTEPHNYLTNQNLMMLKMRKESDGSLTPISKSKQILSSTNTYTNGVNACILS